MVDLIPQATRDVSFKGAVLARGAFFNTVAFLASNLRGIFMLLVARLLGSAALGTFGLAWATMDLVSKFGTLGLDYSAIAFVARAEGVGDRAGSRKIMRAALALSISSSIAIAVAGFWLVWNFGSLTGQRPEFVRATAVMLLALPGIVLYRISNGLSRGMAVMHHDIYSRGLTESLGTVGALLVALALGLRELAPEIAAIVGTMASGLVAFTCARRLFIEPDARLSHAAGDFVPRLMRASAPIALYDLLNLGIMNVDIIMLGWFVGRAPGVTIETLGIYAAGVQLVGGLRKVSQVFTPIFTPIVAQQIAAGRIRDAEESYGYLARWMLAVLLPVVAVLALSGSAIMTIFGAGFYRGGVWAAIVGAACAMNAFFGLGETVLMVERPKINLLNSSIAFAAAVGLNLVLIPAFGPLGAAFGMLVPYALQGMLRGVQLSRLLHWRWPWGALIKPWIAAFLPLPLTILLRLSVRGVGFELGAACLYLAAYLLAWRIIGLDSNDRAVLDRLLSRKKRRVRP